MKRTLWERWKVGLVILGGGSLVLAGGGLSCASFGFDSAFGSTNFCFLFNCNEGAFGGLIDFCAPVRFQSFVGDPEDGGGDGPFLADCQPQQLQ